MTWRIVFSEEGGSERALTLYAAGDIDEPLLEGLEAFIARQRKRLTQVSEDGTIERRNT